MQSKTFETEVGGKKMTAEFTDLTNQADGSVIVRYGDSAVLATVVMNPNVKEGQSFFPLTVDYEEKFYAAGQILGSRFMRREGKPSEEAILSARIVDRTIRPLFPEGMKNEVQVVITMLSIGEDDPDILAVNAASLALATSQIPWNGPVSAVRIGRKKGEERFTVNPHYEFRTGDGVEIEMVACGRDPVPEQARYGAGGLINMIEVGANEASEKTAEQALAEAAKEIEKLQEFQEKAVKEMGKEKVAFEAPEVPPEFAKLFDKVVAPKMDELLYGPVKSDSESDHGASPVKLHHGASKTGSGKEGIKAIHTLWHEARKEKLPEADAVQAEEYLDERINDYIHEQIIENDRRPDGRKMDEVRPLFAKAGGISPVAHGSGIFYRGGTHILTALTLGSPQDSLIIDTVESAAEEKKRFMHHYNFPPFSVGETGRMGGMNRRMIGHGALAEKALVPMIPAKDEFPYTIRLVSESMASNGSTSMASVCASSLALMDGGVPIKRPVAGIASGIMIENSKFQAPNSKQKPNDQFPRYKILTDIQGPEDHFGDMDFKVAGTREGITAIQMDVKVSGIPPKILGEALERAKAARMHILDTIEAELAAPRPELSPRAPYIRTLSIKPDRIGLVIGPGGKTVNGIKDQTGADIEIEDDGSVFVTGTRDGAEAAVKMIEDMTKEYNVGEKHHGEVVKILDIGAIVKLGPSTDGLLHISEIAPFRVEKVTDVLKEGDVIPVQIKNVDERGRYKLSLKDIDPDYAKHKQKR